MHTCECFFSSVKMYNKDMRKVKLVDNNEKYAHWEDIAQYDLETAKAMLSSGRFLYVVFMCQQSIEKFTRDYTFFIKVRKHHDHTTLT